jgi:hypothetical protein
VNQQIAAQWKALGSEGHAPYKAAYEEEKSAWRGRHPGAKMWKVKGRKSRS